MIFFFDIAALFGRDRTRYIQARIEIYEVGIDGKEDQVGSDREKKSVDCMRYPLLRRSLPGNLLGHDVLYPPNDDHQNGKHGAHADGEGDNGLDIRRDIRCLPTLSASTPVDWQWGEHLIWSLSAISGSLVCRGAQEKRSLEQNYQKNKKWK